MLPFLAIPLFSAAASLFTAGTATVVTAAPLLTAGTATLATAGKMAMSTAAAKTAVDSSAAMLASRVLSTAASQAPRSIYSVAANSKPVLSSNQIGSILDNTIRSLNAEINAGPFKIFVEDICEKGGGLFGENGAEIGRLLDGMTNDKTISIDLLDLYEYLNDDE